MCAKIEVKIAAIFLQKSTFIAWKVTDGRIYGLCDCNSSVKHPSSLCYLLQNARIPFNGNLMDLCFYKDFEFLIERNIWVLDEVSVSYSSKKNVN